jgi:hypothetical protein
MSLVAGHPVGESRTGESRTGEQGALNIGTAPDSGWKRMVNSAKPCGLQMLGELAQVSSSNCSPQHVDHRPRTSSPCRKTAWEEGWLFSEQQAAVLIEGALMAFAGSADRAHIQFPLPDASPPSLTSTASPRVSQRRGSQPAMGVTADADLLCETPGGRLWYLLPSVGLVAVTSSSPTLSGRSIRDGRASGSDSGSSGSGSGSAGGEDSLSNKASKSSGLSSPSASFSDSKVGTDLKPMDRRPGPEGRYPDNLSPPTVLSSKAALIERHLAGKMSIEGCDPVSSPVQSVPKGKPDYSAVAVTASSLNAASKPQCQETVDKADVSDAPTSSADDKAGCVAIDAIADVEDKASRVPGDCCCAFSVVRALVALRVPDAPPRSLLEWSRKIACSAPEIDELVCSEGPDGAVAKLLNAGKGKAAALTAQAMKHARSALTEARRELLRCPSHSNLMLESPHSSSPSPSQPQTRSTAAPVVTKTSTPSTSSHNRCVTDVGYLSSFGDRFRVFDHSHLRNSLFGKVFSAVDRVTGKRVAVKLSSALHVQERCSLSGTSVLENPFHEINIMKQCVFCRLRRFFSHLFLIR